MTGPLPAGKCLISGLGHVFLLYFPYLENYIWSKGPKIFPISKRKWKEFTYLSRFHAVSDFYKYCWQAEYSTILQAEHVVLSLFLVYTTTDPDFKNQRFSYS